MQNRFDQHIQTICFIIVPSFSKSKWLNNKLLEVTRSFVNLANVGNCQVYEVNDYTDIKNYKQLADLLVVVGAGNVISDRDHFWKKLNTISDDIGLLGNLLQFKEDELPYLHEQFFIIRSSLVDDIDFTEGNITDYKITKTEESMHGDYAPLEVFLDKDIAHQTANWGTKVILKTLKKGLRVRNFDDSWRYGGDSRFVKHGIPVRGYVYPKKSTEQFEQAHKSFTLVSGIDDSQELYINAILDYRKYNSVNIWSWDPTIANHPTHTVAVPATGFLGEITAYHNSASKIIFYDINKNNLKFKKHLYKNWNGKNYTEFVLEYCAKHNLNTEPESMVDIKDAKMFNESTQEKIFNNWQMFKNMEKEYVEVDIIKDPKILIDKLTDGTILHTSTILQYNVYPFTTILYDREEIEIVKCLIKNKNIIHYEPGYQLNELLLQ